MNNYAWQNRHRSNTVNVNGRRGSISDEITSNSNRRVRTNSSTTRVIRTRTTPINNNKPTRVIRTKPVIINNNTRPVIRNNNTRPVIRNNNTSPKYTPSRRTVTPTRTTTPKRGGGTKRN